MERILAIEADPRRRHLLTMLVGGHVKAELTVVDSVNDAIARLDDLVPDVVLAPTLLSPQDEADLMTRIKQLPSRHVQTLTVPALDMLVDPPKEEKRRLPFSRRRKDLGLQYDPSMVASLILDGLDRARTVREEHEAALAHAGWLAERSGGQIDPALVRPHVPHQAAARTTNERRRSHRIGRADVPWLSGIQMPWGLDLDLINISSTGLLVESTSKLSPGVTYDLRLAGPERTLVVQARIIRSEVGRVDGRGVRYCSAAAFEKRLDVVGRRYPVQESSSPQALADLLAMAVAEGDHRQPESPDVRFARGLRQLVRARDVLVRRSPVTPSDGSESIYFHVNGEGRSRTILQVLFEPDRVLTAAEFRLLKAAASLTAALIELDTPRNEPGVTVGGSMASVA